MEGFSHWDFSTTQDYLTDCGWSEVLQKNLLCLSILWIRCILPDSFSIESGGHFTLRISLLYTIFAYGRTVTPSIEHKHKGNIFLIYLLYIQKNIHTPSRINALTCVHKIEKLFRCFYGHRNYFLSGQVARGKQISEFYHFSQKCLIIFMTVRSTCKSFL